MADDEAGDGAAGRAGADGMGALALALGALGLVGFVVPAPQGRVVGAALVLGALALGGAALAARIGAKRRVAKDTSHDAGDTSRLPRRRLAENRKP